jgi:hypothetical protein
MKRCIACHTKKPDAEFPAPGALTCNFCTPTTMPGLNATLTDSPSQSRLNPLHVYGQLPTALRERARNEHYDKAASDARWYDPADGVIRTQRATAHDDSVKRILLNNAKIHKVIDEMLDAPPDDRPLIDQLHEATFTDPVGLQWIADKYALRMILRKANCFTLDAATSSMVADFSIAIATDLESARRMAIPPFPVTWIDIDNRARLARTKALGIQLTATAAGETEAGPAVERVGWLIRPAETLGYYASYVTLFDEGVFYAPLSYWWHTGEPLHLPKPADVVDEATRRLAFGVRNPNVDASDATLTPTPLENKIMRQSDIDYMEELAGELRHIWGLMIALGAGQLGLEARYGEQAKPTRAPPTMKNGKPLLPITHKVLTLHLAKRMTVPKVLTRMITHHQNQWHKVRSHFRLLKSGKRVPVRAHERGDERLGRIEKTYSVER